MGTSRDESILLNRRRHELHELEPNEPYCCGSLYRIRNGMTLLAVIEFIISALLLALLIDRIRMYHSNDAFCIGLFGIVDTCGEHTIGDSARQHQLDHAPIGLDYALVVLLAFWLVAVSAHYFYQHLKCRLFTFHIQSVLMIIAVHTSTPLLLLPHCILQAATLAFSVVYFATYAIGYFYNKLNFDFSKVKLEVQ